MLVKMLSDSKSIPYDAQHGGISCFSWLVAMLVLTGQLFLLVIIEGCAGGFRGYGAMVKVARSELSARTLARDQRLTIQLREALVLDQAYEALAISPYVFMERGFVVGLVENAKQATHILRAAQRVTELRSLYGYLPVREQDSEGNTETRDSISDLTISAEVKTNLALVPDIV